MSICTVHDTQYIRSPFLRFCLLLLLFFCLSLVQCVMKLSSFIYSLGLNCSFRFYSFSLVHLPYLHLGYNILLCLTLWLSLLLSPWVKQIEVFFFFLFFFTFLKCNILYRETNKCTVCVIPRHDTPFKYFVHIPWTITLRHVRPNLMFCVCVCLRKGELFIYDFKVGRWIGGGQRQKDSSLSYTLFVKILYPFFT